MRDIGRTHATGFFVRLDFRWAFVGILTSILFASACLFYRCQYVCITKSEAGLWVTSFLYFCNMVFSGSSVGDSQDGC